MARTKWMARTEWKDMTEEELQESLTDIINARESYPDDTTNKKALTLDEQYLEVDDVLDELRNFVNQIRRYVMDDTTRKENFTDVEICCEDDNEEANAKLEEILEGYTWHNCVEYLENEGFDYTDFLPGEEVDA